MCARPGSLWRYCGQEVWKTLFREALAPGTCELSNMHKKAHRRKNWDQHKVPQAGNRLQAGTQRNNYFTLTHSPHPSLYSKTTFPIFPCQQAVIKFQPLGGAGWDEEGGSRTIFHGSYYRRPAGQQLQPLHSQEPQPAWLWLCSNPSLAHLFTITPLISHPLPASVSSSVQ